MQVRFWGVRGSLASPGKGTLRTGGNTSCVEARAGDQTVIFDLGTGLRPLGLELMKRAPVRASLFLSHYHWDHIAGLPFFAPAYDPKSELVIHGATRRGRDVRQILSGQMIDPYFPVDLGVLNARLRFVTLQDGGLAHLGKAIVRAAELNHPGGALGFRLEHGGRAMVYATDFEHGTAADERLVELAHGADLMVFDAQYTPAEYDGNNGAPSKRGWGHSTYEIGAAIARKAGVKKLALYHHSPERDDKGIEHVASLAKKLHPGSFAAREGLEITL
ncbi:MAG TPA: MBL fold metallo-hydrolase [Myxococcales bacterium]|nr:MBL fold metallo-hydrolase [Myxococcales bacterium]